MTLIQQEAVKYNYQTGNGIESHLVNLDLIHAHDVFKKYSDSELIAQEYNGPIYFYNTNKKVKEDQIYKNGLLFIHEADTRDSSTKTPYGRI